MKVPVANHVLIALIGFGTVESVQASWSNSSGGGPYGSSAAACKAMIDPGSAYVFSHVEPKPGDPRYAYCYSKPQDGKGEPSYIGVLSKEEDPPQPAGESSEPGGSAENTPPPKPQGEEKKSAKAKDEIVKTRSDVRTHLHHVFPQTFYKEFKTIGIDVDDYVMQLPVEKHIGKNGVHVKDDYNGRWEDFFNRPGKRTPQEAEAYLIEILNEMGIAAYPIGSGITGEINITGVK